MNPHKPKIVAGRVKKSPSFVAMKATSGRTNTNGGVTVDFSANVENIRVLSRSLNYNIFSDAVLIYTPSSYGEAFNYTQAPKLNNFIKYSEQIDNPIWTKTSGGTGSIPAFTADTINNPIDSGMTADRVVFKLNSGTTVSDFSFLQNTTLNILPNTIYTMSFYCKTNDLSTISLQYRDYANSSFQTNANVTSAWTRFSTTFITGNISSIVPGFALRGSSATSDFADVAIYGVQVEQGSGATTYQRTTDAIIDFNFSRADVNATVTNKDGSIGNSCYNLFQYSNDLTNSIWTKTNLTPIVDNSVIKPNNTNDNIHKLTNTSSSIGNIRQNVVANNIYSYTLFAKAGLATSITIAIGSPKIDVNLTNGNITNYGGGGSTTVTLVNDGWYKISYYSVNIGAATGTFIFINSTISSDYLYVTTPQLTQGSTLLPYLRTTNRQNIPKLDYSLSTTQPSLLIEPARTNLLLQSESFDVSANWVTNTVGGANLLVTPNVIVAPNGTLTADKLASVGITAPNDFIRQQPTLASGTTVAFSIYVNNIDSTQSKLQIRTNTTALEVAINWNGSTLTSLTVTTGTSASFTQLPNNWYRVSGIATTVEANPLIRIYPDAFSGGKSIYVWGAQLEAGSNSTSYIPTTTATVTRNAETSYVDLWNNNLLSQTNFTLYCEGYMYWGNGGAKMITLSDTTGIGANTYDLGIYNNVIGLYIINNGTPTAVGTALPNNSYWKFCIQYNNGSVKFFRNGIQIGTTQSLPVHNYRYLSINSAINQNTYTVSKLALFNRTLSDLESVNITSPLNNSFASLASTNNYTLIL